MKKKQVVKKGGGKLNRTETVTLRLDPKLRYLTGLAALAQRRTTSGFIEWAIEQSLGKVELPGGGSPTLAECQQDLWDIHESDRFVKLAFKFPELLTFEEQVLWKLIQENGAIWKGDYETLRRQWSWGTDYQDLILKRLREEWDTFKGVAAGELDISELPAWEEFEPGTTG